MANNVQQPRSTDNDNTNLALAKAEGKQGNVFLGNILSKDDSK